MSEVKKIATRDSYGAALVELAKDHPNVVVLDADVAASTRTNWVRDRFPDHFYNLGISEQDLVGTAAGLALGGQIPYVSTYGVFLSGRAFDQIRTTVCYNNLKVRFGGAHAGISVGPDGATHQALEDLAARGVLFDLQLNSVAVGDNIMASSASSRPPSPASSTATPSTSAFPFWSAPRRRRASRPATR